MKNLKKMVLESNLPARVERGLSAIAEALQGTTNTIVIAGGDLQGLSSKAGSLVPLKKAESTALKDYYTSIKIMMKFKCGKTPYGVTSTPKLVVVDKNGNPLSNAGDSIAFAPEFNGSEGKVFRRIANVIDPDVLEAADTGGLFIKITDGSLPSKGDGKLTIKIETNSEKFD